MGVPFFIARRYLFSKSTRNAVNFISFISLLGFTTGTFALVVVLSVFNGFETVINKLYNSYDPDIKIIAAKGKFFTHDDALLNALKGNSNIYKFSFVTEENGLLRYDGHQTIANIKGVDSNYFKVTDLTEVISDGDAKRIAGRYALFGRGLAAKLGIDFTGIDACQIYMPDKTSDVLSGMGGGFTEETVMPTHEFAIQQELDGKTLIVPMSLMQNLLKDELQYSAIEVRLRPGSNPSQVIEQLKSQSQNIYTFKDRYEQHELLNRIMKSEKRISFILLAFILLIVSFNLTAGLVMLVLEKRENIKTIKAMGGSNQLIKNIFLVEGMYICTIGTAIGLILGFAICQLQISYGFIPIGDSDTLVISSYPVAMKINDFIGVAAVALITGYICSYIPTRKAASIDIGVE